MKELLSKYQKVPVEEHPNDTTDKPTVSVCVQTYNHVNFIKQNLEGILMQKTDFHFEILLGEDESADGTREICKEYAVKYPEKIRLFLHSRENNIKINGTPTGRFNLFYNLSHSMGKYIALCEGDDYWTDPYKLQKQVDFLEGNEEYVMCGHDAKVVDEGGCLIRESKLPAEFKRDCSADELKRSFWVLTLSMCFRNVIKEFPAEINKVANGDTFLISLLGQHGKYKYMPEIKPAVYRSHEGGVWSNASKLYKSKQSLNTVLFQYKYFNRIKDFLIAQHYYNRYIGRLDNLLVISIHEKKKSVVINTYFKLLFNRYFMFKERKFWYLQKSVGKFFLSRIYFNLKLKK